MRRRACRVKMAIWATGVPRIVRPASLAGVISIAAGLAGPVAQGEPRSDAALIWQAPASCPDVGDVRARIERRLGTSIDRMAGGIAVEVQQSDDGGAPQFVARIDLRGMARDEVRVLTSARCDELTDAVAVVVARIAREAAPSPAELRVDRSRSATRAPAPVPQRPWGAGMRLVGISGIGLLPGVGAGGELSGYVRVRSLIVELAAERWMGSPGGLDASLDLIAVRTGWAPADCPLRGWLVGELGTIDGNGLTLNEPRMDHGPWIGIGTGFAVAWPMTQHARLVGTLEIVVPVQQSRFLLGNGSEMFRSEVLTVRSGLGLEIGWW